MHLLPESLALALNCALCALLLGLGLHRDLRIALRNLMQGVRRDSQMIRKPVAGSAARRVTHPCGTLVERNHQNVGPGLIGFALPKALRRASPGGTRFAARLDRVAKAAGLAALGLGLGLGLLAVGLAGRSGACR